MFPFNYIPDTIDPKLRKLIIWLISIQFCAFLLLIIILTYEYCCSNKQKEIEVQEGKQEDKKQANEKKAKKDKKVIKKD